MTTGGVGNRGIKTRSNEESVRDGSSQRPIMSNKSLVNVEETPVMGTHIFELAKQSPWHAVGYNKKKGKYKLQNKWGGSLFLQRSYILAWIKLSMLVQNTFI